MLGIGFFTAVGTRVVRAHFLVIGFMVRGTRRLRAMEPIVSGKPAVPAAEQPGGYGQPHGCRGVHQARGRQRALINRNSRLTLPSVK